MSRFQFQENSAAEVYKRLAKHRVVALADEAGLGKTHVIISIIEKMALEKPRSAIKIFYVASNLQLANENARKLEMFLKERLPKVDRIPSVQKVGNRPARRILELRAQANLKPGVHIIALTPATSLTFETSGTRYENSLIGESGKKEDRPTQKRELALKKLEREWTPDLLILDEYQSYVRALELVPDQSSKSILPAIIQTLDVPTLLVSATPFEVSLPSPEHEVKTDDRRLPMSFKVFAQVLCCYDQQLIAKLLEAQSAYALAWETLLHAIHSSPDEPKAEKKELGKAKLGLEGILRPRIVRTYRSDLADPRISFEGEEEKFDAAGAFADLVKLHKKAHGSLGWSENSSIFLSSLKFFAFSERGKGRYSYSLGRQMGNRNRTKLLSTIEPLYDRNTKGVLLRNELDAARLNSELPPLWVSPSRRGAVGPEKILVFSAFRAVPIEICERLKDKIRPRGKAAKWYLSQSHSPEEASLFWPRPGHILDNLGADKSLSKEADESSISFIVRARGMGNENQTARRIFKTKYQRQSWEDRTKNAPGV